MKVLVIEDKEEVAEDISVCIRLAWPQCDIIVTADKDKSIDSVETESPNIVILDLKSHNTDSFKVLRQIRSFSNVPIIVLAAKEAEMDKVKGLEMGADDYVIRPWNVTDFIAKVKAVLRRATMPWLRDNQYSTFASGNLMIDFAAHEVLLSGEPLRLTPTEYDLLCNLARNEDRVLSHRFLLEKTWCSNYIDDTSSLKKYIYRLRIELRDNQNPKPMLITQRGIGYKFLRPR